MENLTKENFWNALYEKYPKGVQVFCDWIDEYKKKVNWTELFADIKKEGWDLPQPVKYHDLPRAMQIGIWIEFVCERGGCQWEVDLFDLNWEEDITEYFKMLQEKTA